MRKKFKTLIVTGALALAMPLNVWAAEDVTAELAATAQHAQDAQFKTPIQYDEYNSDLLVSTLAKSGKLSDLNKQAYLSLLKNKINAGEIPVKDLSKVILAIRAIGADPTNFEGQNLIQKVYNDKTLNSVNGYAFALIALDSADYNIPDDAVWTKQKLIDKITSLDSTSGGWNWSGTTTDQADPDTTGMVLTALSKHKSNSVVYDDIKSAVAYLKKAETANGGFDNWGENSSSTAEVVIGLSSIGVDPTSSDFDKNGKNPVNHLLTYKLGNGGYMYMASKGIESSFSTREVFQAFVAYDLLKSGSNDSIYSFPYEKETTTAPVASAPPVVNNNITVSPANVDLSKLNIPQSTKEVIREVITKETTSGTNAASNTNTASHTSAATNTNTNAAKPQIIIIQQPAPAQMAAGTPKVEVKVEKEPGKFNTNNLKVGGTTAFIGALALVLRRKFLGA